jgi:hypothetical protein
MLEQPSLLVGPWAADVRPLLTASGEQAGFVKQAPAQWPRWLRWLERRALEVYEVPDGSLVFALRRNWGWPAAWHVLDAEDRHVGSMRGRALLDSLGHLLGVMEPPDGQGQGRFLSMQGKELGHYRCERAGTWVIFAAALEGNPFARMLLLGAVLAQV